ncbi:thiamine-phosphate kinase [Dokdonella sp.]|uniref:thiamine-phosphate kinase n=1 Tax=Dokdonella sp. TaxID=2291710 RepID=UPI003C312B77
MAEFDLIEIIKQLTRQNRPDVRIGIGDDAAVVCVPPDCELVICSDTLVSGVHFPVNTDPADIGWKSLAVNLSDLAAMGATPAWATLAMTLPVADSGFVERFAKGFAELAAAWEVDLVGGDTTRGPLSITVTAHGFVPAGQAIQRSGATVGDAVYVTGTLGDAAAGLRILQSASALGAESGAHERFVVTRLNRPQARIGAGTALRELASACIDISDGLLADLGHVASSSAVGIEIGEDCLPQSTALAECFDAETRTGLQMWGGDDYELAFTIAEANVEVMREAMERQGCRVSRIGRVIDEPGVHVLDHNGRRRPTTSKGWDHFK